jgi:hypothetical protein
VSMKEKGSEVINHCYVQIGCPDRQDFILTQRPSEMDRSSRVSH